MPDTAHRSFGLLFIPIPPGYRVQLCRLCLLEEASGAKPTLALTPQVLC